MKKQFIRRCLLWLCAAALCISLLPAAALAQDFYGEGNVLIAVDMGPYAENEAVSYPEGTLGTLRWGEDAPTGISTRAEFNAHSYTVPEDITPPQAPDYAIETTYTVGQRVFYMFLYAGENVWFSADALPPEVFDADGAPRFLIHRDCVKTENGETLYLLPSWETEDGEVYTAVVFLEIACVAVTEHSTVWQYTGAAYADWPDFDPADYGAAVELTEEEIQYFKDTCDEAYTAQGQVYGDPRWEDRYGDRDGKAAYVALDLIWVDPNTVAFYSHADTDWSGFDCLVIGAQRLPGRSGAVAQKEAEDFITGLMIHELNHYIVTGCIGHMDGNWSMWVGEAFAQSAIHAVRPENVYYEEYYGVIGDDSSRLRVIPGMLWCYNDSYEYPTFKMTAYILGAYFLRYIERETTGLSDGRLWTDYFAHRTPAGSITGEELDGYLRETTGEGLDAWMARFMAAVVVGADSGPYCMGEAPVTAAYRVDPYVFFRPWEEYGKDLSFDGAADDGIVINVRDEYNFTAVEGGGTVYAWRNDAGGNIAVTGAEDRWWFFAVNMDLPGAREVIDIASAEELAKIGHDPAYLLSGRYRLTADIDLNGKPWTPIGDGKVSFTGEFDGNGHSIRGLYVDDPNNNDQGLFGLLSGNAEIHDLTVYGSVTGREGAGAIVGYLDGGGTVRRCESYAAVTGKRQCGGIAGRSLNGRIEDCRADCNVECLVDAAGIVGASWDGSIAGCTAAGTLTASDGAGGIVSYFHHGTMENCRATATVSATKNCGGIVGYGSWATITNCRAVCPVSAERSAGGIVGYNDGCSVIECSHSGSVIGTDSVGGVVGYIRQCGTIRSCYQTSAVRGTEKVGGVAGAVGEKSTVRDCYSAGTVTGETDVGGVAGRLSHAALADCYSYQAGLPAVGSIEADDEGDTATVTACYGRSETGGEGFLTTAEFARRSSFEGWDFETVWSLENGVRPVLRSNREAIAPEPAPWYPDEPAPEPKPTPTTGPVVFSDVAESDWFYAAVQFAAQKGYFLGTGEGAFSPTLPMTCGMFMTVLARMAGEVIEGADWQARAVAWAVGRGVSDGSSTDAPITREQLVTMLWRICGEPAGSADLSGFTDAGEISGWAAEAMRWAVGIGLVQGRGGGVLAPGGQASRAEVAQILMNYIKSVG